MVNYIYNIPSWLLGIGIVSSTVLYAVVGLIIVRRLVSDDVRAELNDVTAAISATAGIAYAVILAFVGIAAWESFGKADEVVRTEAASAIDLWLGMRPYPIEFEIDVRNAVEDYVNSVIDEEWPLQQNGAFSPKGDHIIENLHRMIGDFAPQTIAQQVAHQEVNEKITTLSTSRRTRHSINASGIHPTVYSLIILGTMLVISFSWALGTRNFKAHLMLTSMLGVSIGLIIFLIVAMDWPFRGEFSIGPDAFEVVREDLKRLAIEQPPSPAK